MKKGFEVIILCGGSSKRMKPYLPFNKALAAVSPGCTMLDYQINWLIEYGAERIVLAIDQDTYVRYLSMSLDIPDVVDFSVEQKKLGTCCAVKNAIELISSPVFYLMNVDDFVSSKRYTPYKLLDHISKDIEGALLIARTYSPYGVLEIDDRFVLKFNEKPRLDYWVNTGHIAMSYNYVKEYFPREGNLDRVLSYLSERRQLVYRQLDGDWFTVNNMKQLEEANRKIQEIQSHTLATKIFDVAD